MTKNCEFIVGGFPFFLQKYIPVFDKLRVCIDLKTVLFISKQFAAQAACKGRTLRCDIVDGKFSNLVNTRTLLTLWIFGDDFGGVLSNGLAFEDFEVTRS